MLTPLAAASAATCGGKANALGALLREGLPVPDGFVVPFDVQRTEQCAAGAPTTLLRSELAAALGARADPWVAVRSSAANEDSPAASAAGQYESVLAVRGAAAVGAAIHRCWASARAPHVAEYWTHLTGEAPAREPAIAVLVQRLVEADASGVMFTPLAPGGTTRIEASWGLGPAVVGGAVSPDSWQVRDGRAVLAGTGDKATRLDRQPGGDGLITREVADGLRGTPAIEATTATRLDQIGTAAAAILGRPQDIEWAVAGGKVWILQARPVTAPAPALPGHSAGRGGLVLTGSPGSRGTAQGAARILRSTAEAGRVRRGDILICRFTDPAWTPLFRIAGGIVTETGGALSHAAIVAREHRIPAVIGVPGAANAIRDGSTITIDGTAGTVTLAPR